MKNLTYLVYANIFIFIIYFLIICSFLVLSFLLNLATLKPISYSGKNNFVYIGEI